VGAQAVCRRALRNVRDAGGNQTVPENPPVERI
jgi:hypothetical protein